MTDLLAFCAFIIGLMIGMITFQFSNFSFGIGNAAGLLFAGIMLGFLRANHPTFGYIPQGALNMVKEFGLMVFMAGVGLSAGSGISNGLGAVGGQMLIAGLVVNFGTGGDLLLVWRLCAAHEPGAAVRRHDGRAYLRPGDGNH